jgi:cellobiose-specific phosphotransferase system component IIB
MASIVLVCVAAVSGTFLASRLRDELPDVDIRVSTLTGLPDTIRELDPDAVVVAPQLAAQRDRVRTLAAGRHFIELGPDDYAPARAAAVGELLRATLDSTPQARH